MKHGIGSTGRPGPERRAAAALRGCSRALRAIAFFLAAESVFAAAASAAEALDAQKLLNAASEREKKGFYALALEKYREVIGALGKESAEQPGDADLAAGLLAAREGAMRTARMTGELEAAAALAGEIARGAADEAAKGRAAMAEGEILFYKGALDEARKAFENLRKSHPRLLRPVLFLGLIEKEHGRGDEAYALFDTFTQLWLSDDFDKTPDNLISIALGAVEMSQRHQDMVKDAQRILEDVIDKDPGNVEARVALGNLMMAKYVVDRKYFTDALKENANYPDAHVGLAACCLTRYDNQKAAEECRRALKVNPRHVDALVMGAMVDLADQMYDQADKGLSAALAVNPRHLTALSLSAGVRYMRGDREGFEAVRAKVFGLNPKYGEFYHMVSGLMQGRRLDEIAGLLREAVKVNPKLWIAHIDLGITLSRMGNVKDAVKSLESGFKGDSYHVQARNLLTLFDAYDEFATRTSENFEMLFHKNDQEVMGYYAARLLERGWKQLTEKYGFSPERPVKVEIFRQQEDFATRTVGFPGLGALGACFGPLVTMDSPHALPPGAFNWASTAWHEFAHVVTLQMSGGRIPRWFTEGISVYEERQGHPAWTRPSFREFYGRYLAGKLVPIAQLNPEFTRGRVLQAYFHASWVVEFIVSDYGFEKLAAMVREYGRDKNDSEVFKAVLGLSMEEAEKAFLAWVGKRFGNFKMTPLYYPEEIDELRTNTLGKPGDAEGFLRLARACLQNGMIADAEIAAGRALELDKALPGPYALLGELFLVKKNPEMAEKYLAAALEKGDTNYAVPLILGRFALEKGESDRAIAMLEKALEAFPEYTGGDSPYALLPKLYLSKGLEDKALKIMEQGALRAENDIGIRIELAGIYGKKGRNRDFVEMCRQITDIWPYRVPKAPMRFDTHFELAKALLAEGEAAEALAEARIALSESQFGDVPAEGREEIEIRLLTAEAAIAAGDKDEARAQIDEVLEVLEPGNQRALDLREKLKS